jgi:hypothetical protein
VCAVIPAWSWLDGSGWLAWTMFSHSATYRVRVTAVRTDGVKLFLAPTALGARATRSLGTFLAGSERWRHAPVGSTVRRHLPEIAILGCGVAPGSRTVEVQLEERRTLDAPVTATRARVDCTP